MTMSNLKDRPKEIIKMIDRSVPYLKEKKFFSFQIEKTENYIVATAKIDFDDDKDTYLCYTLNNGNIYMTVSDGNPKEIGIALSEIKSLIKDEQNLRAGYAIELNNNEYLNAQGRYGAVLLTPHTLPVLDHIPYETHIFGEKIKFFLVVFLSQAEISILKQKNFDNLLDHFTDVNRDIIRISVTNH
jgi:hypothetical protein